MENDPKNPVMGRNSSLTKQTFEKLQWREFPNSSNGSPTVLVLYLRIPPGTSAQTAMEHLRSAASVMSREFPPESNVKVIVLPITEGDSRVECVNPAVMTRVQFGRFKKYIEYVAETVDRALRTIVDREDPSSMERLAEVPKEPRFFKLVRKVASWPKEDPDISNP